MPTAATKGVLVAPTVYGNVLLGPTAEDIDDRSDTGTTAAGLAALLEAGHAIVPDLAGEQVTATYAGLRAATEHRDYQIRVDPARRYACVAGIRSTGLSASLGIAEYVTDQLAGAGLPLAERGRPPAARPRCPTSARPERGPTRTPGGSPPTPSTGGSSATASGSPAARSATRWRAPCRPPTAGGLRRRTRAMNGRCQGFYCAATVSAMMAAAPGPASGPAGGPGPAGAAAGRAPPAPGRLA